MIDEATWKKAEINIMRRERQRLFRLGFIKPAHKLKPQMMVQDESGRWCPQLGY